MVQRPASVVKELVENSLDAGADQISVEIERGGKRLIRVSDNGQGLSRDDALLSIERYATSKIFSKEDLFSISTFGFRGEALPSIASVSKFAMVSRTDGDEGATRIDISGGKLVKVSDAGAPRGTMIEVRQLFFNTPARRKFLKTDNTEGSHISDALAGLAMGNPKIGFRLFVNGRLVRHFPKGQTLSRRAGMLLGKETAGSLYPLDHTVPYKDGSLSVSGVCANPSVTRSTAGRLYYFVNARLVRDSGLTAALFQGYRGRIMKGRYPVGVICIDLPFNEVDVNVHPAKREIKFLSPQPVYQALVSAVSSAMARAQATPLAYARSGPVPVSVPGKATAPFLKRAETVRNEERPSCDSHNPSTPSVEDSSYQLVRETPRRVAQAPEPWGEQGDAAEKGQAMGMRTSVGNDDRTYALSAARKKDATASVSVEEDEADEAASKSFFVAETTVSSDFAPLIRFEVPPRVVGQVLGTYIVAEHENHLLLVDQHAAHERITYDALKKRHEGLGVQSQDLMVPEVLELTHREADLLEGLLDDLGRLGIRIEPFGGESFIIKSIPVLMEDRAVKPFVADVLDTLAQSNEAGEKDGWLNEILISMACHRAIRANKAMKSEEMEQLLRDLWQCENPMHCPHGRPILLSFDAGQLEKLFKRVV